MGFDLSLLYRLEIDPVLRAAGIPPSPEEAAPAAEQAFRRWPCGGDRDDGLRLTTSPGPFVPRAPIATTPAAGAAPDRPGSTDAPATRMVRHGRRTPHPVMPHGGGRRAPAGCLGGCRNERRRNRRPHRRPETVMDH